MNGVDKLKIAIALLLIWKTRRYPYVATGVKTPTQHGRLAGTQTGTCQDKDDDPDSPRNRENGYSDPRVRYPTSIPTSKLMGTRE
jgi:hypothetical protein